MYSDFLEEITPPTSSTRYIPDGTSSLSTDLIEKLSAVSLTSEPKNNNHQIVKNVTKMKVQKMKLHSNNRKFEKENNASTEPEVTDGKNANVKKSNPQRFKRIRKRKEDSFIVSDSSPVDNDSIIVYHRVLAERIKADVATLTPNFIRKKKNFFQDDGIFTPFTNREKYREVESDSSEKENMPEAILEKSYNLKSDIEIDTSHSDVHVTEKNKEREIQSTCVNKSSLYFHKENLSWSFSDEDSAVDESKNKKLIQEKVSDIPLNKKNSIPSTPVVFHLNKLKNLTPKNYDVRSKKSEESMSFLRSLSASASSCQLHPEAETYKKKFKKLKEQLAANLFRLFNEEIFDNRLPGDLKIEWSARMRSSSGFCYNSRNKTIIGPDNGCLRLSRIVLSSKIIETAERLRDTLIHEMCHAAAWIINKKADGHGPCWKSWALKVQRKFPELPQIKRCHDYSIKTKFKYKCVQCGYTIGRHSKSLNLERKRCGFCYGKFELILNNECLKSNTVCTSPRNVHPRPLSKFALFVKENYGRVKSENLEAKHGEIMKILSKHFADTKNVINN